MTNHETVTEPLRAEHRVLMPRVRVLESIADDLAGWERAEAVGALRAIVRVLRDDLVPHAHAEEAVLYPAVEAAMGAPGATATMRADHAEIVARIEQLEAMVADVEERTWPDPSLTRRLVHQLIGIWAIIDLHFRKEETVLLPVLDEALSADDASALFERMEAAVHR
jgi:iron-sulfur cluster repair protein YtfE (RIC family)